ncbi:hypothetical protein PsorP6_001905 [Peronosclerospora sorghi]|uniref:Uncharacterized protein n=1 Tax=Peronosclerospora sorghi TaxID=230839 RepID=A0ACC0WVH3_9STRA|nr:hypothetical protein PsorP6_001905 [Peronosclerospora sorghi]
MDHDEFETVSSFLGAQRREAQAPCTRNVRTRDSIVSTSSTDEAVDESTSSAVSITTIRRDESTKVRRWDAGSDITTGDETDDTDMSSTLSGKSSLHVWKHLVPATKIKATSHATVMYSISFYPWKMESHCYYSHPEAAANWVPDTASICCQICQTAFTLTRRRHHCRLCGHLVCSNCSHDRTYLPFATSGPSQHRLIKDGAPQRTCSTCATTLRKMAGQDDPRVKRFTVAISSAQRRRPIALAMAKLLPQQVVEVEVERPSLWVRRTGIALHESDLDEDIFSDSTKGLPLDHGRVSITRAKELEEILSARTCSQMHSAVNRRGTHGTKQFVISSTWLNQWLRYVHADAARPEATSTTKALREKSTPTCRIVKPTRPGPVANYKLLDFVNGVLVPKANLQRSRGTHVGGDYRVVSQEVWTAFLTRYGGGPSIQVSSNNNAVARTLLLSDPSPTSFQWNISELDDGPLALNT